MMRMLALQKYQESLKLKKPVLGFDDLEQEDLGLAQSNP